MKALLRPVPLLVVVGPLGFDVFLAACSIVFMTKSLFKSSSSTDPVCSVMATSENVYSSSYSVVVGPRAEVGTDAFYS